MSPDASVSRTTPVSLLLLALAASAISCAAHAPLPSPEEQIPYAGNPAPAELQVLAPWVGEWSLDIQVAPNAQSKQGVHFTGKAVGQQLLNGQFIRVDGQTSNGATREEFFILYGYDPGKAVYRRWYYSSIGLVSEFEGRWDASRKEMTWNLLNPARNQTGTIVYAVTADMVTVNVTYKDSEGNVVRSVVNRATRKPRADASLP
ncbi:DUF1579 family protein [Myxococcus landrumensis]|uniref:DUF1579 family protein n=1 Tax=Myxococcus landrumensis TaxID=2813577 RepID=A0ABX7N4U5_9BACT|nr:DUF1579 family protein [Myxococcus landrumus]QSQ13766.1 DUF1579 family protein [Myxococcus landrumus]